MLPDSPPRPLPSPANPPGRALRWADRLVVAGLVLLPPTFAIKGLGFVTLFLIPCCFYLSWVGYVAAWPVPRGGRWWLVGVSLLAANVLVLWMTSNGYLKSALVCGAELLVAWYWQRARRATGHWIGPVALALWLAAAGVGLRRGHLHEAVRDDNLFWTKVLLWSGADANATVDGQSALYEALSWEASPELIDLLLRHGANPNAYWKRTDGSIVWPVAFAFHSGADSASARLVLRMLLAANLNPCQPDPDGNSFRHYLRDNFALTAADSVALARAEQRHGCR